MSSLATLDVNVQNAPSDDPAVQAWIDAATGVIGALGALPAGSDTSALASAAAAEIGRASCRERV